MGCSTSLIAFSATSTVKQTILVSNEVLSREDINRIKKTWKLISTDVVDFGVKVLLNLFQLNPCTKRYFLPEDLDGDLLTNIRFKSHATRLIQTFQIVVDNIDSMDTDVKPVLLEIGKQHSGFAGFQKDFWDSCHDAILQTWKERCPAAEVYETELLGLVSLVGFYDLYDEKWIRYGN